MSGVTLGVGNDELVGGVAEDATERIDLCRGTAAARGRVGFVGNEHRVRRDLITLNAAVRFGLRDQVLHDLANVLHIETRAVESAIGRYCAQYFTNRLNAAFTRGGSTLNHKARSAHAHNQAVPPAIEGSGGL